MNILMVSSYLPYPLFSGGHVRLYNILKELSKKHIITLICEKRVHQTEKDIIEVKKFCRNVITVDRKKQWSFKTVSKTGFSKYPFLLVGHANQEMKEKIKEVLAMEIFSLIHVETFYVMQNIPRTYLPIVLIEHNIEYLVYQRFAAVAPVFLRPLLYIDTLKLKYWEKMFWKKATKIIAVSEEEKKLMKRRDAEVVENGVDLEKFKIQNVNLKLKKQRKKILFIGDFKWIQNTNTARFILHEVWPLINSKLNKLSGEANSIHRKSGEKLHLKLWVVGKHIPDSVKKICKEDNIIFDEDAPGETEKIFEQADILLAPIRVGGGTSFKILEAMACGVPVITTHLGVEGIEAVNEKEVLIAETAEDLANCVLRILHDEELYKKISVNARKMIEEKYDWKIIVKKLETVYKSAIE